VTAAQVQLPPALPEIIPDVGTSDSELCTVVYLTGSTLSQTGDRPFLDILVLSPSFDFSHAPELQGTKSSWNRSLSQSQAIPGVMPAPMPNVLLHRVWQSQPPFFEKPLTLLNPNSLLMRRQSEKSPPNYFVINLSDNSSRPLTHIPHPAPHLLVTRWILHYERSDGVKLSASLYLPPGVTPSQQAGVTISGTVVRLSSERTGLIPPLNVSAGLPTLVWVYPKEFDSQSFAEQTRPSPYRFVDITRHPTIWATQGFAVLVNPTLPIIAGKMLERKSAISSSVSSPFKLEQVHATPSLHVSPVARDPAASAHLQPEKPERPSQPPDDAVLPRRSPKESRKDRMFPNDSFVPQLVAGAQVPLVLLRSLLFHTFNWCLCCVRKAAVDALLRLGVTDASRLCIGGHSYGAFTAANLLVHAPHLFAAGIARSGAYNRTLTPFGFQNETRSLWKAREVYMRMSPFLFADQLKKPLLLIHGEADENYGTYPDQSRRFFDALKGHGSAVRFVELPYEAHRYRSVVFLCI